MAELLYVPDVTSLALSAPSAECTLSSSSRRDSLMSLPSEIVMLVLAYIPTRPKILVLCLVCKRLLMLTRRSITHLPGLVPESANSFVFQIFPSVTSLENWDGQQKHNPSGLRVITGSHVGNGNVSLQNLSLLSNLESVDLTRYFSYPLVWHLSSKLTNLVASNPTLEELCQRSLLPSLTSLTIEMTFPVRALTNYLPNLRHLGLYGIQLTQLSPLVHLVSNLVSLEAWLYGSECLNALATHYTNVKFLSLSVIQASVPFDFTPFALRLYSLRSLDHPDIVPDYGSFTLLTSLEISAKTWRFSAPLPHLRILRFFPKGDVDLPRRLAEDVYPYCPALTEIHVSVSRPSNDLEVARAVAAEAERRGLTSVQLYISGDKDRFNSLVHLHKWLQVKLKPW